MKMVIYLFYILILVGNSSGCCGQAKSINTSEKMNQPREVHLVGGGCDGCELMYVGMPEKIFPEQSSIGWSEGKQKLIITGKIFRLDGRTPAPNVLVYYWHTDDAGLYSPADHTQAKAKRHGKLRGWVQSDQQGNYTIKTSRPSAYPQEEIPQHIHLAIREPDLKNEYYADLYFDDDPLYLKHKKKYGQENRAGTELLRVVLDGHVQIAEHNIILGLNIPHYPVESDFVLSSGLSIGEDQPSFMPYHAFGPDQGSRACPVCKYGRYHGIVFFVGNHPIWDDIKAWLVYLDRESMTREKYLKTYFVYGNSQTYQKQNRQMILQQLGQELGLQKIALTFVPSFDDVESEANLNKINPEVESTIIIYKHRTIVDKYINLKPSEKSFTLISEVLDKSKGDYFYLPEPHHK